MSDLIRMQLLVRDEEKEKFTGTQDAYYIKYRSEDGLKTFWHIFAAGAPSTDFNTAPLDSLYTDTTNHIIYIHTATATWTKIGAQT